MKALILLACLLPLFSFAQTEPNARIKKTSWELTGGAGVSYFAYSSSKVKEHFASPDFRVGTLASRSLTDHLFFQYGLRLGVRLKTTSLNYDPMYVNVNTLPRVEELDKTSSQSDQFFFEIPIVLHYQLHQLGFSLGATYKNYIQFDNVRYRNYTSTRDVGINPGISYQITPRWRIGAEYYYGLMKFSERATSDQSMNPFTYKAYNRYAQISIAYSLRKK